MTLKYFDIRGIDKKIGSKDVILSARETILGTFERQNIRIDCVTIKCLITLIMYILKYNFLQTFENNEILVGCFLLLCHACFIDILAFAM